MKFREELTYDAPPAQVRAMLADEGFRSEVCTYQRVLSHEVAITQDGAGMRVRIEQTQPAKGIPAFAAKFIGDTVEILQEEDWSGERAGDLSVTIPGKPGSLKGTIRLEETATGTREIVEGDIKVSIPLVGGKIEKLIGDLLAAAIRAENTVGREWLAR